MILVGIANIVAWPAAYITINRLMQNFAYKIHVGIFPFIVSGSIAFIIAVLTVSLLAVKIIKANPVDTLRVDC